MPECKNCGIDHEAGAEKLSQEFAALTKYIREERKLTPDEALDTLALFVGSLIFANAKKETVLPMVVSVAVLAEDVVGRIMDSVEAAMASEAVNVSDVIKTAIAKGAEHSESKPT
jgi:hypothetical protein